MTVLLMVASQIDAPTMGPTPGARSSAAAPGGWPVIPRHTFTELGVGCYAAGGEVLKGATTNPWASPHAPCVAPTSAEHSGGRLLAQTRTTLPQVEVHMLTVAPRTQPPARADRAVCCVPAQDSEKGG